MPRKFDIVVWGATGFTGTLVAEYFCRNYGVDTSVSWAIAGRSEGKLRELKDRLQKIQPQMTEIAMIVADASDSPSLRAMAAQTRVVCSTVGPFLNLGSLLVEACVQEATNYCDITGETPFIREMIDQHHETAKSKKIKIVHSCGYDSIPSDLGVLFVQKEMLKRHGQYATEVRFYTGPTRGGVSGGTIASMAGILERSTRERKYRKILGNPYSLNPKDGYRGVDGRDQMTMKFDARAKKWTAPFIMAGANTRIVRRSHALQAYEYGETFRYSEVMGFPAGAKGWRRALQVSLLISSFTMLMLSPWTRKLMLRRVLPKPGEGPKRSAMEAGFFTVDLLAEQGTNSLWGQVYDNLDPGYLSTAKMLSESALCLALQNAETPKQFGVVTTAVGMGMVLVERLRKAGMRFSITEETVQT